uniref:Rac/Cdc42 guanine nucleotide exchange factor 6 n=1 Tax=Myripristis murdjan TaxID=586833 RepID=A0A667XGB0_9TELE
FFFQVVQDILEHEREFVKELQTVLSCYLRPLQYMILTKPSLSVSWYFYFSSPFLFFPLTQLSPPPLCWSLSLILDCLHPRVPEGQQRVAGCYLNLMSQIKTLYLAYCSSHPSAVCILTDHSEELDKFMESQGASAPGILTLTTSLSKPFMRLDKYPTLLQELERHVEEAHPDCGDILKATAAFKSLVTQCQDLRKRKNLELQILSEPVRGWEGDSMKSLGHVAYMSQVHMKNGASEEKEERYLMLFPNVLIMLSASPRMSGFIYQGRLPLTGTTLTKQAEDSENAHYAFDITGGMIDRVTVFCSNPQELQEWLEHLQPFTKGGSPAGTIVKVRTQTHTQSIRPRPMKKFLPGNRKKERKPSDDDALIRKSTAALEEDAQILKVIEAYCTGASLHQTTTVRKECIPQVLLPEEEKIIVEEMKSNGQTVIEEKSLVDAVYALKDEVHELKKENKWIKQFLEEEQKSRKELERVVRKLAKQKNDCAWEDSSH